jgi:hypothetical protein
MYNIKYPIKIIQTGILTNEQIVSDGFLSFKNKIFEFSITSNIFKALNDSSSRFEISLEFEYKNSYEIFTLDLEHDDYSDFEIIKNDNFKEVNSFFLNSFLNDNITNNTQKKQSIKI